MKKFEIIKENWIKKNHEDTFTRESESSFIKIDSITKIESYKALNTVQGGGFQSFWDYKIVLSITGGLSIYFAYDLTDEKEYLEDNDFLEKLIVK